MENEANNKEQVKAAFRIMAAVAESIRESGEVPSGTLYAALMGKMDLEAFNKMIGMLKNTGLVEEKYHLLRWIGPEITQEVK